MVSGNLDTGRLRIAFVVYGGMNRRDWREVSFKDIDFDERKVAQQLVPTLRTGVMRNGETVIDFGRRLAAECQEKLSALLPFTDKEKRFLDRLLDEGIIDAGHLTDDAGLQTRIESHPMLAWKARNVRQYKRKEANPGSA